MKINICPVCGNSNLKKYGGLLLKCQDCTHIVAKEIPSDKELKKHYESEYFFGKEYFDYLADRPALEKNFKARLKKLSHTYRKDAHIIEIGSAYGYFLNLLKDKVASHNGYELNKEGVEFASKELGVKSTTKNFLDARIQPSSIDTIYMWDVIEHLAYPQQFLEKIEKILKPGGYVVLSTGDIGALIPKLRKDNWRLIHPPTHLHYFTSKSIKRIFENNNMKVISIRHKGVHRNLGSVLYQLTYNRKSKQRSTRSLESIINLSKKTGAHKLNIPLNTFDIMEVVAVKK